MRVYKRNSTDNVRLVLNSSHDDSRVTRYFNTESSRLTLVEFGIRIVHRGGKAYYRKLIGNACKSVSTLDEIVGQRKV